MNYWQRIKNLREDNDYKQVEVSNYLNCYKERYVKWENGINAIPLEYIIKLSIFYNVSLSYILGLSNEKKTASIKFYDMKIIGINIAKQRSKHFELQKDLAILLNCSVDSISNYEKAKNNIPVQMLIKICQHYNISVEKLLDFKITETEKN